MRTPDFETQVIAHLLDKPKHYTINSVLMHEGLFFEPKNRAVYLAYVSILKSGRNPDMVNISEITGDYEYVLELSADTNYNAPFDHWLEKTIEKWKSGEMRNRLAEMASLPLKGQLELMRTTLSELGQEKVNEVKSITYHTKDLLESIDRNLKVGGELTGFKTGITKLDRFTNGMQKSDLVIVAGDTSQGKTSLALTMGRTAAIESKIPVGIFSLEMSTRQLTARLVSQQTGVSSKAMMGKLSEQDISTIHGRIGAIDNAKIFIDDCTGTKLSYIISAMQAMHLRHGVQEFIVDYLQLINNSQKGKTREQEVGETARALKNFAKETDTCVIALSQLHRGQNARAGQEPRLSDLRDSGQIEEAADLVILCYRPEVYGVTEWSDDRMPTENSAELIIAKGRNVGIGTIRCGFDKKRTLFLDEVPTWDTMPFQAPQNAHTAALSNYHEQNPF